MNNDELVAELRRAASIWFKNSDLLLLEELIKRFRIYERLKTEYISYMKMGLIEPAHATEENIPT